MVLPPFTVVKRPSTPPKTVLITGCSQGGLGSALAQALHARGPGIRVLATARTPSKMAHLEALGIETLALDVLSPTSIAACVAAVTDLTGGGLDILINNSGAGYSMPLADADLAAARECFDLNVWALLAVTQAFLPLLLESASASSASSSSSSSSHRKSKSSSSSSRNSRGGGGAMIVNNTSVSAVIPLPSQGIYNASKAAAAMLTDNLRLELAPFRIRVVDLRTGGVKSNFRANMGAAPVLPKDSIYAPARAAVERAMADADGQTLPPAMTADVWAERVVRDLLLSPNNNNNNPPTHVWRGQSASTVWFFRRFMPYTLPDGILTKAGGLDVLAEKLGKGKPSLFSRILARIVGV